MSKEGRQAPYMGRSAKTSLLTARCQIPKAAKNKSRATTRRDTTQAKIKCDSVRTAKNMPNNKTSQSFSIALANKESRYFPP